MPEAQSTDAEIAVVIPAYNPGGLLVDCVESVLAQTFTAIEIVVVDDGSASDHFPVLPPDPRLHVRHQANEGVSAARNHGVSATTAPLVAFLDADDRWDPKKLERQLALMAATPDAVMCHTGFSYIDLAGSFAADGWHVASTDYLSLLRSNSVMSSSVVVRRKVLERAGGFDPFYSIVADWDLWLRLAKIGPFVWVDESLADYRLGPHGVGQLSGDPWTAHQESFSILGRHELVARRTGDVAALRAIHESRANSTKLRSSKAAFMFVDSVLDDERSKWPQLGVALRISPGHAALAAVSRATSHMKHSFRTRLHRF